MNNSNVNHVQCHAKSKQSGQQCKSYPVKGKKVCRMHGAFAGIKTKEGRERQVQAVTKHGLCSKKVKEERKMVKALIDSVKNSLV